LTPPPDVSAGPRHGRFELSVDPDEKQSRSRIAARPALNRLGILFLCKSALDDPPTPATTTVEAASTEQQKNEDDDHKRCSTHGCISYMVVDS
jgi:hypothetical protein